MPAYEVDAGVVAATTATAGTILANGQATRDTTGAAKLTTPALTTTTFNFTATSTSSTIRFVSLTTSPDHNAFGPVIDNVIIQPVPEPATLGLLGCIAVGGLGLRRRRRVG